ncbi:MAG: hypothetical protein ACKVRN_11140 [Pyrinomonadaceae bacterium]
MYTALPFENPPFALQLREAYRKAYLIISGLKSPELEAALLLKDDG